MSHGLLPATPPKGREKPVSRVNRERVGGSLQGKGSFHAIRGAWEGCQVSLPRGLFRMASPEPNTSLPAGGRADVLHLPSALSSPSSVLETPQVSRDL